MYVYVHKLNIYTYLGGSEFEICCMCILVTKNGASSLQKEIGTSCHWLVRCLVKVQANNKPSAKPTVAYMYKSHSTVIQCILGLLRVSQHPGFLYHI